MSETTPAPQRTEETMPEEIRAAMERFGRQAYAYGCRAGEGASAPTLSGLFEETGKAADALETAILRALRSPADRIAELEARVGTLSVALEMARSPASARCACTQEAGDSPCPVHGMDEEDLYIIDPAPAESAAPEQEPTHFCEKCGYVGRSQRHRGCDYYALPLSEPAPASPPPVAREAAPSDLDALETQIRAFSKRIGLADNGDLELIGQPSWSVLVPSRWRVRWRRSYCPHGSVVSDWREVEAESLPEALAAAEEWESENDRREPQHAVSLARESAKESK